jgi:hypothetical protein
MSKPLYTGLLKAAAENFLIRLFEVVPKAVYNEKDFSLGEGASAPVMLDSVVDAAMAIVTNSHPHGDQAVIDPAFDLGPPVFPMTVIPPVEPEDQATQEPEDADDE